MVKAGGEGHNSLSGRVKERGSKGIKKSLRLPYVQGLFKFFSADSYMYGALLCPPGEVASVPRDHPEAVIRKEIRKKKKLRVTSRNGRDVKLAKKTEEMIHKRTHQQGSHSTYFHVNVQHAVTTPDAHERSALRNRDVPERSWHELSETEDNSMFGDNETSLQDSEAEQVSSKLVSKFGGRISKELGIEVDQGDDQVERWFLAVALFNRISTMSSKSLKNIVDLGLERLSDALTMSQEELAKILEKAGCSPYPERSASRLYRLAVQLKTEHGGTVCSLKGVSDPSELSRKLNGLVGLSPSSTRVFLRELRGVWPGVTFEFDTRAQKAARHLKLTGCRPTCSDERDVEAALTKLASSHGRHYRECPGGTACEMLLDVANPQA